MSAQDELPPGWEYTTAPSNEAVARGPVDLSSWTAAPGRYQCAKDAWRLWSRASGITREELATMRAAQEFTRVVCELLGNEGSGMDVSTDVLQDMLTAAGVTP